ncbi:EndoU domain-containing protein [Serratia rubidaea]|uniref:RHS repeat-associated core domain-containing protein n=2 Tax=Serratia rubidaea TaxID=61652 RepID=UPI00234AC778|nr:RHS repeat-associated core domain-containing protein [Serratia rubidaea]MDC6118514.1 EndoU domain-containing protein [Serratia rubidaea]
MSDLTAARLGDPLVHSSLLADFVSGLVEGAIYAGIYAGATALISSGLGAPVGIALVAGAMVSGIPEKIGTAAGALVDTLIGTGPPDAFITSGSDNVHMKGKPAARAAGTVDHDFLNSPDVGAEEGPGLIDSALAVAGGIISSVMHPGPLIDKVASIDGESVKNWLGDVWDDITQPTVESASPYATPASKDTVACTKGHMAENVNFLAEGSKKVLINGHPAARNGDRSTCEAKIEVADNPRVRIGGDGIVVRDIRSGKNALAYFAGGLVGALGKQGMKLGQALFRRVMPRQALKDAGCALAAVAAADLAGNAAGAAAGATLVAATQTGHPVHIPTGAKILAGEEELDFTLPDRIPLYWQRLYNSRNRAAGMLGVGWMLPFETRLLRTLDGNGQPQFILRDASGRETGLGNVTPGDVIRFTEDGFTLYCSLQGVMLLQTAEGEHQLYEPDPARVGEWRIARIYDRHENCHHYAWNSAGQLVTISSDNQALDVELSYDARHGRLIAVHQRLEQEKRLLVQYDYSPQGQLIAVRDADAIVTRRYGWDDASGLLAWHSYATDLRVSYRWQRAADGDHWRVSEYQVLDAQQQCLEHWLLEADEAARRASVTCLSGGTTEHRWDSLLRITDYTDSYGARWRFRWAALRENLSAVITPDDQRWELGYDERGNLILVRDPLGNTTQTTWHPAWALPLKEVLPDGACWQYRYNPFGDVVTLTDPLGNDSRFTWNDQGDLLTRTDALGNTQRFWWNALGQLTRDEDCSGHQNRREYDDAGLLLRTCDAEGNTTRYRWSAAGRLQALVRPDGRETRYDYDRAGLPCRENIDAFSERRVERNVRGQITCAVDPAGIETRYQYDRFGRLTALVNPNNERWQFDYDAGHRLLAQSDFAGRRRQYRYNLQGQVSAVTEYPLAQDGDAAQPLHTRLSYDALGRLSAKETADSRTEYRYQARTLEVRRAPLALWQQAQARGEQPDWPETLRFSRDAAGNLCAEENHSGLWQHSHDPLGNLSATQMPDGSTLSQLRYGSGHLLQTALLAAGQRHDIAGWQRDKLHREVACTLGAVTQETRYDSVGRITLRRASSERSHPLVFERRYQWDRQDLVVQQKLIENDNLTDGPQFQQRRFGYDARGQLTHSILPQREERFYYDPAGNRSDGPATTVWRNLLQRLNGHRWGYDGFGRLSWRRDGNTGVEQRFQYDAEHRLTAVTFDGDSRHQRAEYRYDALGRRTRKTLYPHHGEPQTTLFHWNGLQMVGEHNPDQPQRSTQYLYREDSYEPLARVDRHGDSSEVYWYHSELNGLPERMTDAQGKVVWHGRFSAWGATDAESGTLATQQNLRYQGQYLDRETGLHYNLFRYYDPNCGRFTQSDPIGLAGGVNTYAYTPDPISWVDPLGLAGCAPKINAKHVFHGEINRRGNAVGFHHEASIGHQGKARITEITDPVNAQGVYRGKVEVFNPQTGQWVQKGPESTFFPKSWNRQKVLTEIKGAHNNATINGSRWEGVSPSGVKIGGYLDSNGNINTAFPVYER